MKTLVLTIAVLGLFAVSANAETKTFAQKHPRRAEVIKREKREKKKNDAAAKDGKITKDQAKELNGQDNAIRGEERADAKANNGHITKAEQKDLNKQENQVNQERRADEKNDAKN